MLVTHIIIAFNHGINSAIYKAGSLTVPSHTMILPGTIPDTLISCEWSQQLEWPLMVIPDGRMPGWWLYE